MEIIKKFLLWVAVVILCVIALATIPSFASVFAVVIAFLVLPIGKWQNVIRKYIKGKIKVITIFVIAILMISTFPKTNKPNKTATGENTTQKSNISNDKDNSLKEPNKSGMDIDENTTQEPETDSTISSGDSDTEVPHTHSYSAATCTTSQICSCGATIGNPKGHNWQAATYTSPKTCSNCGLTEGDPLEVPGKGNYHGHVYTGGASSKKYHYEVHCAGKNSHEITWEDVEKRKLEPCGTCVLK